MKKILLTIGLAAITSASVFAQGNFVFSSNARYVWDNWSIQAPKANQSNNVAFLIGTGSSLVDCTGTAGTATNGSSSYNVTQAWTSILNDPNFHLATNSGTGNLVVSGLSTLGGIGYLSGGTFTVAGTAAGGGVATIYVIGWSSLYADPFLAAAAGAPVGWSSVFSYAYAPGPNPGPSGTPGAIGDVLTPFGVGSGGVVVPEPTTLALAGLGAASLLIFRRRKQ